MEGRTPASDIPLEYGLHFGNEGGIGGHLCLELLEDRGSGWAAHVRVLLR